MEIKKKYTIVIEGNLYTEDVSAEIVERTIEAVPSGIADLINDNLPEGLVCTVCYENKE